MDCQSVNNVLPGELWIQIFKFLSQNDLLKASTACKEFYSHAMDPILWKTLDLELNLENLMLHQNLLKRCTGLLKLQLRGPACSPNSLHAGVERKAIEAMAGLMETLPGSCNQLRSLQTLDCPYVTTDQMVKLNNLANCSINQTTHFNLSQFDDEQAVTWTFKDKEVAFHQVGTTDYYRKGNPYKILTCPGSSIVSFRFNIPIEPLSSVTIWLNHCRTTADGIVCMTVNGKPAEMRDDGKFGKKVIMAPRFDFGRESFPVSLELLQAGVNKITLCLDSNSPGVYWLSDAKIETVLN